jgi:hypothetical protein
MSKNKQIGQGEDAIVATMQCVKCKHWIGMSEAFGRIDKDHYCHKHMTTDMTQCLFNFKTDHWEFKYSEADNKKYAELEAKKLH